MPKKTQKIVKHEVCVAVGNGHDTSVWKDLWLGSSTLTLSFPRLYILYNDKDSFIVNMGV
jgi:hypothetical protein